jgi:hypothetical protein
MSNERDTEAQDNRTRKIEGRAKKRRFVQGTRAYTHAISNSILKRAKRKTPRTEEQ